MAPYVMQFDAGKSITRVSGRGLGPTPPPHPLAQVMELLASKAFHTGPYQSEVHR
jgi:hypothetical protein